VSSILAPLFADRGYVTASIDYRLLSPEGCRGNRGGDACSAAAVAGIADGQAAVSWLRAHAAEHGIDAEHIGIAGESAGGVVATAVGTWPAAASSKVQAWMSLSGGLPNVDRIDADDAPGLLFSGTADAIVPYDWSKATADAMRAAGVAAQLVTYEGAGHVPFASQRADIIAKTAAWFRKYVGSPS
jgi:acetyl esterase/lipase